MVGFVIESPLAQNNISSTLFNFLYHIYKVLLFFVGQFLIILCIGNVKVVLSFWLWWFKRTSQNCNLSIGDTFFHLRMREFFVNENSLNQLSLLQTSSWLTNNFDEVEIDIFSFHISYTQNCINSNFSQVLFTLGNNFWTQSNFGTFNQILSRTFWSCLFQGIQMVNNFITG